MPIAEKGGDSIQGPTRWVPRPVDRRPHSLAVEHAGFETDAFEKNSRQFEDRPAMMTAFHFINWTQDAFRMSDVISRPERIMHQNQSGEDVAGWCRWSMAWPFRLRASGTRQPIHPWSMRLGVISVGVAGLERKA